jgi:hypothetical protein
VTKDDPFRPRRRGGRRRKGERSVRVYGTTKLLQLFECKHRDELLAKLRTLGIDPNIEPVAGYVEVSDYQLPDDLRAKADGMFPLR